MTAANKVIFNTIVLYTRVVITSGITLYTTRIVLNSLGDVDYGIFTLIAGIVLMLSFLNTAMTTSTQRHLSVAMGENNDEKLNKIFSNSLVLHLFIGLISLLLLEATYIFLFEVLNIPSQRINAAKIVYQIMIFSIIFTVIIVPFNALLVAYENMLWIAFSSIINVLLNLFLALTLHYINSDKLIYYSFMVCLINVFVYTTIFFYCKYKYIKQNLHIKQNLSRNIIMELFSFGGWSLFGIISTLLRLQIVAVILNIYLGPVINAAYGIANQITNQINFFSSSMLWALNPQIMKSEGSGDRDRVKRLSITACKLGYFLLAFIAIPMIFEMRSMLKFWLKDYPANTEYFCSFMLIAGLVGQLTIGLKSATQAINKIMVYETITGSILLLNIPIIYILLKLRIDVQYVIFTFVIIQLLSFTIQLLLINKLTGITFLEYVKGVLLKITFPTLVLILSCKLTTKYVLSDYAFFYVLFISSFFFGFSVLYVGLSLEEKKIIQRIMQKITRKI